MPTQDDIQELLDNCDSEMTTLNGVNGRKFTSKINGKSIFFPAAGGRWNDDLWGVGGSGDYMSSTLEPDDATLSNVYILYFYSGGAYYNYGRWGGCSVRPVLRN